MSRHAARLAKLEAAIPVPCSIDAIEDAPGLAARFDDLMQKFAAEQAHFDALTPAGKILFITEKIASKTVEAAKPVPAPRTDRVVDIAPQIHACLVQEVKQGFRAEYYAVRGYELEILDAAGHDTRALKSAHAAWKHLPWQWRREDCPLLPEAQLLIDTALSVEVGAPHGPASESAKQ